MSERILLLALLFFSLYPPIFAYNYCYGGVEQDLCKDDPHIVCYPEQVASGGDLKQLLPMTSRVRDLILGRHNEFRDMMASGDEKSSGGVTFPAAARMMELSWDDELAYIASVHAARCNMEHDKCHNTKRFPYSGQNLAFITASQDSLANNIMKMMTMWYDEKDKVTSVDQLAKFNSDFTKDIGHLTCLVCERTSRVGCAIAACTKGGKKTMYMTCNYENNNVIGMPVYTSADKPAMKCSDWNSKGSSKYLHLCENTGNILDTKDGKKPSGAGGGGTGGGGGSLPPAGGGGGGTGDGTGGDPGAGDGGDPAADPGRRGLGISQDGRIGKPERRPEPPQYPQRYTDAPEIEVYPITSIDADILD